MCLVSCVPAFNWTAWLLPTIPAMEQTKQQVVKFALLSALYALPLIVSGLNLDSFSASMFMISLVHMQIERLVATEPETLDDLLASVPASLMNVAAALGAAAERAVLGAMNEPQRTELPADSQVNNDDKYATEDLREFDEKLQNRIKQKERGE